MVYITLAVCYKFYLQFSDGSKFYPDYFTNLVAKQSRAVLNTLDYNAEIMPHPNEPSMKLVLNGKYLARVIEAVMPLALLFCFYRLL